MIGKTTLEIKGGGVRLDAAILHTFPTSTRAFVREAVERGSVTVAPAGAPVSAARRVPKGFKLRGGETIVIESLLEASDNLVLPEGECPPPVFEDAALLAFDKPAGIPVQPLSHRETGTLMNAVVTRYPECRPLGDVPLMAGALHRIDADTSGLVLVARTAEAFDTLRAQFADQTVKKTYLALVEGEVEESDATLENDLVHDPTLPFCRMIDSHDRKAQSLRSSRPLRLLHAVTAYRPIAAWQVENETRTLLEVTIYTGVTHQIRAQLAIAGHHIVNDRLYGAFAIEGQKGHCLHALSAGFIHPITRQPTVLTTPAPAWAHP